MKTAYYPRPKSTAQRSPHEPSNKQPRQTSRWWSGRLTPCLRELCPVCAKLTPVVHAMKVMLRTRTEPPGLVEPSPATHFNVQLKAGEKCALEFPAIDIYTLLLHIYTVVPSPATHSN